VDGGGEERGTIGAAGSTADGAVGGKAGRAS
jgi:hypothetical protein